MQKLSNKLSKFVNLSSVLDKVIQPIIEYVSSTTTTGFIILIIAICIIFILLSLVSTKVILIALTLLSLLCWLSAGIFHFNRHNITWSMWILNIFSDLIFNQSSHVIKKHLMRSDKVSLALSLTISLKLLSIYGAICSIFLICLIALNMPNNVPTVQNSTPPIISLISPTPLVTTTIQLPVTPISTSTAKPIRTTFLTNTMIVSSNVNLLQTPQPIVLTSTPFVTSHLVTTEFIDFVTTDTLTTSVDSPSIVEDYQELVNLVLPRVVIAEVKHISQREIDMVRNQDEYIVLANYGDYVDMSNWYIADTQGHVYHFQDFHLNQASIVRVHTGKGTDTISDLYWGQDKLIWTNDKPQLFLFDTFGAIVDRW